MLLLLSEIINDETMSSSINKLINTISEDTNLTVYIIDLLSDLELNNDDIILIRGNLLNLIDKIAILDNGIIFKFALEYLDIDQLNDIFEKYRNYINEDIIKKDFDGFHILFNTITSLLKCKIEISNKIFKVEKKLKAEEIKIFDLWLLYLCLSIVPIQQKV